MIHFRKARGSEFYLNKLMVVILSIGLILIAVPTEAFAQAEPVPVRLMLVPVDFPTERGFLEPGTQLKFQVILFDKAGKAIPYDLKKHGPVYFKAHNTLNKNTVSMIYQSGNTALFITGADEGAARVEAWLPKYPPNKYPKMMGRQLVSVGSTTGIKEVPRRTPRSKSKGMGWFLPVILAIVAAVGIGYLLASRIGGGKKLCCSTAQHHWCPKYRKCCPSGYPWYCEATNKCYDLYAVTFGKACPQGAYNCRPGGWCD